MQDIQGRDLEHQQSRGGNWLESVENYVTCPMGVELSVRTDGERMPDGFYRELSDMPDGVRTELSIGSD